MKEDVTMRTMTVNQMFDALDELERDVKATGRMLDDIGIRLEKMEQDIDENIRIINEILASVNFEG